MSTLKNGEFGIDLDKEKILWTDRKRHTIFSLPLSFTKYTLTETKLIIQRGCFNLREDEIQLYRVRDIAFKQNFYERLCRVGSIHLCSTDAMTPEIDIRRIKNPRDVKEVLSKTIEACRKANGIRTSEIIGDHGRFPTTNKKPVQIQFCAGYFLFLKKIGKSGLVGFQGNIVTATITERRAHASSIASKLRRG